jgi:hypothetical protein
MMPRCKQGDMAMIIKSMVGNEGKIVTCIRFVPSALFPILNSAAGQLRAESISCCWEVDRKLPAVGLDNRMGTGNVIPDAWLMPIRPGDLNDDSTDEIIDDKLMEVVR